MSVANGSVRIEREPLPVVNPSPNLGEAYKTSDATRLLCASAYLNSSFRKEVIKTYIDEAHRSIAPSFGIDQFIVARHCANAHRKLDNRELWLLGPSIVAIIALVLAGNNGDWAVPILLIAYLIAVIVVFMYRQRAAIIVTNNFFRGRFKPDAGLTGTGSEFQHLKSQESGNVVIYSGFTPFVGSGININGWSFALDLSRTCNANGQSVRSDGGEDRVTIQELYERVYEDIRTLELDRVTVEDKLYVNGKDIRDDSRFFPDENPLSRPNTRVDTQVLSSAMSEPSHQLRHYRCIRVVDWSGELVLSIFLRFAKLSHNLFVEASYFLLSPITDGYRAVDSLGEKSTIRQAATDVLFAILATPFLLVYSPLATFGRIQEGFQAASQRRRLEKQILENPSFDYGASSSLREKASSAYYHRYFQKLDKEMYAKVLEKTVLDSIITTLEEKHVDVSEIKQRQTTILNNGVMVSGGNISAENVAVGQGATIGEKISQVAAKATKS